MSEQKPEPCLFCSSETEVGQSVAVGVPLYWVSCPRCKARGPVCDTQGGAIAAWNAPGEKVAGLAGVCRLIWADYQRIERWQFSLEAFGAVKEVIEATE